jgi:hypothetical protein
MQEFFHLVDWGLIYASTSAAPPIRDNHPAEIFGLTALLRTEYQVIGLGLCELLRGAEGENPWQPGIEPLF